MSDKNLPQRLADPPLKKIVLWIEAIRQRLKG